jgi:hypothetical protein
MTTHKSFKRLVRARMAKTGESYTTARSRLLAAADKEPVADEVPRLACSDERIRERTGRGWEEWFALLDSWGAESMPHTALTRRLGELRGADPLAWDVQAIVASYEWTRGTRGVGERVGRDGWVASASRTIAASAEASFMAIVDPSQRAGWLPDLELHERTVNKPVSARFDVEDGRTRLVVSVTPKDDGRSMVNVEHTRLAGGDERDAQKAFWRQALLDLRALLEGNHHEEVRR